MKISIKILLSVFVFGFLFLPQSIEAQILKKLGKKAQKAAERTVERRVEQETEKKTDEVLDSILEPGKKGKSPTNGGQTQSPTTKVPNDSPTNPSQTSESDNGSKSMEVYSKFDFVPGDNLLFFDDFSKDYIGDFPSKWNTNGSGELVTINDSSDKWLELISGYNIYYIPDVPKLPESYTIEFDILADGIDNKTSSTARLTISLSDDNKFDHGYNYVHATIPFGQYGAFPIRVKNYVNRSGGDINTDIQVDIRDEILNQPHISIAVNKQRYRLWVNEEKYVDVPRMIPQGNVLSALKFNLNNFKDGKERVFIRNVKVAEGGVDLRRKLIEEGKVSTNGILFDSGSANIKPQSYGIIRQISQVLLQESDMKLNIIGHTDADGSDEANKTLSKKRADAVKNALISVYNIDASRLQTEGKGESVPVGDNNTPDGKAQNRRVEFIKM
ncbi:OmpA family protein [Aureibaculum sp. 2210JD6-5]|uniref:OmpA family protein n=1 Tax=Aureibaculum sp. 2210JD6-5 TaxID=3103957 RepID=UPI002AADC243|nr:OmpA family protein [Aureibaculum sp. 2210JD6-5]MDY7393967.1 OmpA family protein [Aureibaculum sp. 2210JD6-5]